MIKDALWGGIRLSDFEAGLLDVPEVQRLRRVKQLALAYLVYPGANHSRFEHSLGTMELAGRICARLGFPQEEAAALKAAALLHDVGHYAFSHELEELAVGHGGKTHEEAGAEKILGGRLAGVLEKNGFSPRKIASLAFGKGKGAVVCGDLGSDRMDYLTRDARYTGVAFGVVDCDRLVECMHWKKGGLVVDEGGIAAAESLLVARFLMFKAVYLHHAVRIASGMLCRAVEKALESGAVEAGLLSELGDAELVSILKAVPESRGLAEAIDERRLFKRAFEAPVQGLDGRLSTREKLRALEKEIARKAGVPEEDVLADAPSKAWEKRVSVQVAGAGGLKPLEKASELVASLKNAEEKRAKLIIACPKGKIARVQLACRKIFG